MGHQGYDGRCPAGEWEAGWYVVAVLKGSAMRGRRGRGGGWGAESEPFDCPSPFELRCQMIVVSFSCFLLSRAREMMSPPPFFGQIRF